MSASDASCLRALPPLARAYVVAVCATALVAVVLLSVVEDDPLRLSAWLLAAGVVACAAGGAFAVFAPGSYSLQPNLAFFFAGSVLLPPWAIAVLAFVCFVPGLVSGRIAAHKSAFNVANYAVAGLAAHGVFTLVGGFGASGTRTLVALVGAAVVAVLVNHLLLALVVCFAQGTPLRGAVLQIAGGLPIDTGLALIGASPASPLDASAPLALLALAPMLLIYRALALPMLEHRVRTDPMTGLSTTTNAGTAPAIPRA